MQIKQNIIYNNNNNNRLFVGNFVGEWMRRPWDALLKRGVRRQTEGLDRPACQQRQRANRVLVGQQKQQLQNNNKTIELLAKRYYKAT